MSSSLFHSTYYLPEESILGLYDLAAYVSIPGVRDSILSPYNRMLQILLVFRRTEHILQRLNAQLARANIILFLYPTLLMSHLEIRLQL